MDWANIIKTVLTNTVFLAILGFVAKSIFEHLLSKDIDKFKTGLQATHDRELEKFRADLRLAAFEHETRFAKLHEERAKVIADLYKLLVQAQFGFEELLIHLNYQDSYQKRLEVRSLPRKPTHFGFTSAKIVFTSTTTSVPS